MLTGTGAREAGTPLACVSLEEEPGIPLAADSLERTHT